MHPKVNALVLAALLLVPLPTAAQQGQSAVLVGIVRDQSGAVVRGASVEVSSASLVGGSLQSETDDTGAYRLAFLPGGAYEIQVQRSGFATVNRRLALTPGLTLTLDVVLRVEGLEHSIAVGGSAPIVDVWTDPRSARVGVHVAFP